jgi:hypothetical protein
MAYYDDPIVDSNSKRSEESVNAVKSLFTRKNGFISREEFPDYGVDLDVELVLDESKASSKKFAIQIKSTASVGTVTYNGVSYISLEFRTSRLGYLARRGPNYGIIVVYEEASAICYFDYVEEIISRLDGLNNRTGWRDQTDVNILIPLNKLGKDELPDIHQKYCIRVENSRLMLQEHGKSFGIPYLEFKTTTSTEKLDFSDPQKVALFLETHGTMLFNENEYAMLRQMLSTVPKHRIDSSSDLIFLSAITNTQVGDIVEAEYFIKKAKRAASSLGEEKNGIIAFSEIRIDFLKGNIDYQEFLERFRALSQYGNSLENQLTIDVNVLWFEFTTSVGEKNLQDGFQDKIDKLYQEIEGADLPLEKKHLLKIYHSETKHTYAIESFLTYYTNYKIRQSLKIEVPVLERAQHATNTIRLTNKAVQTVGSAYLYAKENELQLLKATAAQYLGKFFFTHRSALELIPNEDKMQPDVDKAANDYTMNQNYSLIAFNEFLGLQIFQNAHEALCTAYDIQQLGFQISGSLVGPKKPEELMQIIREIEARFEFLSFEPTMAKISSVNKDKKSDALKNASESELENYARIALEGYNLPEERLPNIVHELRTLKIFEEKCTDPNIEILQNLLHTASFQTRYASPPTFILRHKTTGVETKPSTDIHVLLGEFSTILNQ